MCFVPMNWNDGSLIICKIRLLTRALGLRAELGQARARNLYTRYPIVARVLGLAAKCAREQRYLAYKRATIVYLIYKLYTYMESFIYYVISRGGWGFQMITVDYRGMVVDYLIKILIFTL